MKLRLSLQYKLLIALVLVTALPLTLVSYIITTRVTKQFQEGNKARIKSVLGQTVHQYKQYGALAKNKIEKASKAKEINEIGIRINVSTLAEKQSIYELLGAENITETAKQLADSLELDVFSILSEDGTIISSAHWPAKFGYRNPELAKIAAHHENTPFLVKEETPEEQFLTIQSARAVRFDYGTKRLIVVGGYKLFNPDFLYRMSSSSDTIILFFDNTEQTWRPLSGNTISDSINQDEQLMKLINQTVLSQGNFLQSEDEKGVEIKLQDLNAKDYHYVFTAIPLLSIENKLLGALLIGLSERDFYAFLSQMKLFSYGTAFIGILSAILLSSLLALRVTRPVKKLSSAVGSMARGDLDQTIDIKSHDEIGMLGAAFNKMALDLKSQREKLLQAERVAGWREMARRVAHELKNPLFPIQVSVETMVKAEGLKREEFPRIFYECTTTLLDEINSLKNIINQFSEFARMPSPNFSFIALNDSLKQTLSLFSTQMNHVELQPHLDAALPLISADKDQIGRMIKNLVSNALEAMPSGGRLEISTKLQSDQWVLLRISDTGMGMSEEAKNRLFTPYYTTKSKGTGLGLAIVQSIVADHHGKISVQTAVGQGTTFEIELPTNQERSHEAVKP